MRQTTILTALLVLAAPWVLRAQTVDWTTEAGRGRGAMPDSGVLAMLGSQTHTTRQAVYSSPLGYDYMVMGWGGSASDATTWTLRVKEYGKPWKVVRAVSAEGTEPAPWYERLAVPVRVPAQGDVEIRAQVGADNTMVFGNLDGLLIDRP